MNHKIVLFLVCYLGFVQISNCQSSSSDSVPAHEFRYTNPITRDTALSMRDYCIIKVRRANGIVPELPNPKWTGPNPGVRLLVSDDLIH